MSFLIQILQIIFYLMGTIFMLTLTFLSIWAFVLYHKNSNTVRINNYVLEKIYHSLNKIIYKTDVENDFNLDEEEN